jgi:hypothetical protein
MKQKNRPVAAKWRNSSGRRYIATCFFKIIGWFCLLNNDYLLLKKHVHNYRKQLFLKMMLIGGYIVEATLKNYERFKKVGQLCIFNGIIMPIQSVQLLTNDLSYIKY